MKQVAIKGVVNREIKILKLNPLLMYVGLWADNQDETVNCLIHKNALDFFYRVTMDSKVAFFGHYNSRKQFIVDKFMVANPHLYQAPRTPSEAKLQAMMA
ncbi:hypothetical protein [Levilactobacillus brevis]|uniref:hypothetical protein n=1 Tax=Levilactobacillus brevis TaxID=1580 RepID=UPI003EC01DF0